MLYVLAQQPPTPNGIVAPVHANCLDDAVLQLELLLGVRLSQLLSSPSGNYTDGCRNFLLCYGEKGMEQFGQLFEEYGLAPASIPLFPMGQVVATPAALEALARAGEQAMDFLARHVRGDWGVVDVHDRNANDAALIQGTRVFSAYLLRDATRIWVITEADRSSTCVLLPEDY